MNVLEGARRMQVVGKMINLATGALMLLGFILSLLFSAFGQVMFPPAVSGMMLLIAGIWPLFIGGLVWIAGWVLEGFATPRSVASRSVDPAPSLAPQTSASRS